MLVGTSGSGKTWVGETLAGALGLEFIDMEGLLLERAGTTQRFLEQKEAALQWFEVQVHRRLVDSDRTLIFEIGAFSQRDLLQRLRKAYRVLLVHVTAPLDIRQARIAARPEGRNLVNDPEAATRFDEVYLREIAPTLGFDLTLFNATLTPETLADTLRAEIREAGLTARTGEPAAKLVLKSIRCEVRSELRAAFARGQEAWSALRGLPGFLAQCGGFDGNAAKILALWRSHAHYERFMADAHDRIAERAEQWKLYDEIAVELLTPVAVGPGRLEGLARAMAAARFARVVECIITEGEQRRFEFSQAAIWQPAMLSCPGCVAGAVARRRDAVDRYRLITFWESESAFQASAEVDEERSFHMFPENFRTLITGKSAFALEPAWAVAR